MDESIAIAPLEGNCMFPAMIQNIYNTIIFYDLSIFFLTFKGFIKQAKTAFENEDYPTEIVVLEFQPNQESATGLIHVTNNNLVESLIETFCIVLDTAVNGRPNGITEAEITIIDDDSKC